MSETDRRHKLISIDETELPEGSIEMIRVFFKPDGNFAIPSHGNLSCTEEAPLVWLDILLATILAACGATGRDPNTYMMALVSRMRERGFLPDIDEVERQLDKMEEDATKH